MSGQRGLQYWTFMRVVVALVMVVALAPFAWFIWHRDEMKRSTALSSAARPPVSSETFESDVDYNYQDLRVDRARLTLNDPFRRDIAALNFPDAILADEADYLRDRDRLLVVEVNGQTRAYPTRILNYHELVNDTLGDVPLAAIYCPLTDSFSVVDRRLDGQTLEFGVTGMILNANTVFFDTADRSLWSQIDFQAISGPHAGRQLTHINQWRIVTYAQFRDEHPDGQVLSDYTGQLQPYNRNPYRFYLFEDEVSFPLAAQDPTVPPKTPTLAVTYPDGRHVAYLLDRVGNDVTDGDLHFTQDTLTRSLDVLAAPPGAAVTRCLYFTWYAFHPDTEVIGRPPQSPPENTPAPN